MILRIIAAVIMGILGGLLAFLVSPGFHESMRPLAIVFGFVGAFIGSMVSRRGEGGQS